MAMAATRRGVLALALSSSLRAKPLASAFRPDLLHRRASRAPSGIVLGGESTSVPASDPSLTIDADDYEWLRRSRPVRIEARPVPPGGADGGLDDDRDDAESPSAVRKIVHFQRHGQGTHNELYRRWTESKGRPPDLSETDPRRNPMVTDAVLDAPLTEKGRDQCAERRAVARELDGVEAVVVSPLTRALQTAHITFRDHLPNDAAPHREVTWIAHEGIREELGTLLCNKRRPLSETRAEFPDVDYAHLPHLQEEDLTWDLHARKTAGEDGVPRRESTEDMSHRAYDFLAEFLRKRPEGELAVVGHSAWLLAMTGAVLDIAEEDEGALMPVFGQAELRSMELVFTEQKV